MMSPPPRNLPAVVLASMLAVLSFEAACSSGDSTGTSSDAVDAAAPPASQGDEDGADTTPDGGTSGADASHDAGPKAGPVTDSPTDPTSCDDVCEGAGLKCVENATYGVGTSTYHRANGTTCQRTITNCTWEMSPADHCAGSESVSVDLRCDCRK
jgi:hypothetical protein